MFVGIIDSYVTDNNSVPMIYQRSCFEQKSFLIFIFVKTEKIELLETFRIRNRLM